MKKEYVKSLIDKNAQTNIYDHLLLYQNLRAFNHSIINIVNFTSYLSKIVMLNTKLKLNTQNMQNSTTNQFEFRTKNQIYSQINFFPQTIPSDSIKPHLIHSFENTPVHKPHPKSKFTLQEGILLKQLVSQFGENNWTRVSQFMPNRNIRQCKERWTNYLSPKINRDPWTPEEDALLIQKYNELGAKWVRIALSFPNRTDSNVKNRWLVLSRKSKKKKTEIINLLIL